MFLAKLNRVHTYACRLRNTIPFFHAGIHFNFPHEVYSWYANARAGFSRYTAHHKSYVVCGLLDYPFLQVEFICKKWNHIAADCINQMALPLVMMP